MEGEGPFILWKEHNIVAFLDLISEGNRTEEIIWFDGTVLAGARDYFPPIGQWRMS